MGTLLEKTSIYSTLVGILNAKKYDFGEEVRMCVIAVSFPGSSWGMGIVQWHCSRCWVSDAKPGLHAFLLFFQFLDMLVEDLKSSLALKQFEKARQLVS